MTYTHGLSGDYLLANISPAGGYNGIIMEKLLYIGLISIGVILVYMALGIFLSRKLSSPVHRMTELIERFGFGELGRQPGELAFITDVFQQVAQQKRELEAVNADQAVQLKFEYLRNLLTMSVLPESLLKDISPAPVRNPVREPHRGFRDHGPVPPVRAGQAVYPGQRAGQDRTGSAQAVLPLRNGPAEARRARHSAQFQKPGEKRHLHADGCIGPASRHGSGNIPHHPFHRGRRRGERTGGVQGGL